MSEPCILLTNDDGVSAPGLKALADALEALGDVHVVAPDSERSASSHSLTLSRRLERAPIATRVHALDGTPADCVHYAIVKLLSRRPDLIVSGINQGGNLGDDICYSGTIGGAREGTLFGVHSIAVSLAARSVRDYSHAASFARRLAALVLERGLPERTLLNVNVPEGRPKGVAVTVQGRHPQAGMTFADLESRHQTYYWMDEGQDKPVSDRVSDHFAVQSGLVSVTPLQVDTTNHRVISTLQDWRRDLDAEML